MKSKIHINPDVLKWARITSGKSINDVAAVFKKKPEEIERWESGEKSLTYTQLGTIAYTVYKRPLAIFFFPSPPAEKTLESEFRTLPALDAQSTDPDTRLHIRKAHSFQLSLAELNDNVNPVAKPIFKSLKVDNDVTAFSKQVRQVLGFSLAEQKHISKSEDAFKAWREHIETAGIFVFKNSFKNKGICGFSLFDEEFPIVYINNSNPFTRQIFTLIHELCHILIKVSGIFYNDESILDRLSNSNRDIEVFCNRFASELLLPDTDFIREYKGDYSDKAISGLASLYCVSREVILRRLLDKGILSSDYYYEKTEEWKSQIKPKSKKGDGQYYNTQISYLGENYIKLAFTAYYRGKCSFENLAEYLNMKAEHIQKLEYYYLPKMVLK